MGFTAGAVAIVYFLQPTMCGAQGLRLMTIWGFRRSLSWEQIAQVTFARLYLLQPSLKLIDSQGRIYCISRETKDNDGLYAEALKFGGPAHPLTRALQTPLHALQAVACHGRNSPNSPQAPIATRWARTFGFVQLKRPGARSASLSSL